VYILSVSKFAEAKIKKIQSLCLSAPYAVKTHGVVEVQTYTSLPSKLDGGGLPSSYCGKFTSLEKLPTEYETTWA
jgi:hypothetical protein